MSSTTAGKSVSISGYGCLLWIFLIALALGAGITLGWKLVAG